MDRSTNDSAELIAEPKFKRIHHPADGQFGQKIEGIGPVQLTHGIKIIFRGAFKKSKARYRNIGLFVSSILDVSNQTFGLLSTIDPCGISDGIFLN